MSGFYEIIHSQIKTYCVAILLKRILLFYHSIIPYSAFYKLPELIDSATYKYDTTVQTIKSCNKDSITVYNYTATKISYGMMHIHVCMCVGTLSM